MTVPGAHAAAADHPRASGSFAHDVIGWQRRCGRHDLPWQNTRDAYAIWVSEIMLQQTQVATVAAYYRRFMQRFDSVETLARSPVDDVLALWSGLGYYSRARNMHRAAGIVCDRYGGRFPERIDDLERLPGVGRSTAAAIAVFAHGGRHAILDGNVKRLLARVCAIAGHAAEKRVVDALWQAAERLLPPGDLEPYTQGLMDLGATVCLPRAPRCGACPVSSHCAALSDERIADIPAPRPRRAIPRRRTTMLILERAGRLLLERRPPTGVWGGLWCFPEMRGEDLAGECARRFGITIARMQALDPLEHGFTHFTLTILPVRARVRRTALRAAEPGSRWFAMEDVLRAGIPAPVRRIVERL